LTESPITSYQYVSPPGRRRARQARTDLLAWHIFKALLALSLEAYRLSSSLSYFILAAKTASRMLMGCFVAILHENDKKEYIKEMPMFCGEDGKRWQTKTRILRA